MTLLPCPFCGARGRALQMYYNFPCIECENCGAFGPLIIPGEDMDGNLDRADAMRAWNKRECA